MTSRRPLPDLCLITVFKQLGPNDQLKASQMSPRYENLVRAANRRNRQVKTFAIIYTELGRNVDVIKEAANTILLEYKHPVMQFLYVIGSNNPPMTSCLNKWNCLLLYREQQFDPPTISKQIANIFSTVTDLMYFASSLNHVENLIALLEHHQWAEQLTNLVVRFFEFTSEQSCRITAAISGLSSLNLQVHLPSAQGCFDLSEPFRNRVVSLSCFPFHYPEVPIICRQAPALTTLCIQYIAPNQVEPLFTTLRELPKLIHFQLRIDMSQSDDEHPFPFRVPSVPLPSVRALDLCLTISNHFQVEWLNLRWTLPNLQAIHLNPYVCKNCHVRVNNYYRHLGRDFPAEFECLRQTIFSLHREVHHSRVILGSKDDYISFGRLHRLAFSQNVAD